MATRPKLKAVRKWTDPELISRFFEDRAYRSLYEGVVRERMLEDGFVDFFNWVWAYQQPTVKPKEPAKLIHRTLPGFALGAELAEILASGCKFTDTQEPERCLDFCSPSGNIYHLSEDELSEKRRGMLGLIRDRYRRYTRQRGA